MAGRIGWARKPETAWVVSSWTFRQLLEDVRAQYPDDDFSSELGTASRVKCLYLDNLHPDLTARLTSAIRETARAIASGEASTRLSVKPYGTPEMVAEYRQALARLVALLDSLPDFAP